MTFRFPFTLQRRDRRGIARFDLHDDIGIVVSAQIGDARQTRLVGPETAQTYIEELMGSGWYLIREGRQ